MNRQNFLGHLALALTLVLVAAFAGQVRHWQHDWKGEPHTGRLVFGGATPAQPRGTGAGAVEHERAEVLVRFRSGTSLEQVRKLAAHLNDRLEDEIESVDGLAVIEDEDGLDAQSVADQYNKLTDFVVYAEPNFGIVLDPNENSAATSISFHFGKLNTDGGTLNDPMFNEQWSLENTGQRGGKAQADISAKEAWKKTQGSQEVVVAVLDSGVDYTHPDLVENMWQRPASVDEYTDNELGAINDEYGFNAVNQNGDPMDDNGHGTHCAGIIGAVGGNGVGIAGINWKVKIMPLKFMSSGGFGTTKDAIECINYVINRKQAGVNVSIISASWGSTMKSKALGDAIKNAGDAGITFIAASGNSSANSDKSPHYPASYQLPNVISVAALNRNDELASFSNYGAKTVHVAAPGAEILSTWLGHEFKEASGTSMATPEVAGVAALVLSVEPKLTVEQLRERLFKSVDKLDALSGKVSTGGRINAARAVGAK
jgi:thermitase